MNKIKTTDLSVRFRMSYDKLTSASQFLLEAKARIQGNWQPNYFSALSNINLEVKQGEIVGLIGANGSGKTTLLRAIAGIYEPDAGTVQTNGKISALLQLGTGLNNKLSGRENIILGGLTLGLSKAQILEDIEKIIEFSGIGDFIDTPMRFYSSGMISRLSFSIIAFVSPDILLIDETLSVGDIGFQEKSKKTMDKLMQDASCQIIVSHSLNTIQELATRVCVIDAGKIIADDVPYKSIKEYKKLATA